MNVRLQHLPLLSHHHGLQQNHLVTLVSDSYPQLSTTIYYHLPFTLRIVDQHN